MNEQQKLIIVQCQHCNDLYEIDLNKLNLMKQDEIFYLMKKLGKVWKICSSCEKAIEGWDERTSKCPYCNKLARYTMDEKFIECFGCQRKNETT